MDIPLLQLMSAVNYTPHTMQMQIHQSSARFRIVAAGARAGKSMLAGFEAFKRLLLPDQHIFFVSSQYDLADKEFDWCLEFMARFQWDETRKLIDVCRISTPAKGSRKITTPWGSWAETKSSAKPESLLGVELNLVVIGEASQLADSVWKRFLYPRLGSRKGSALPISTPNWDSGFFREIYDLAESGKDPEYACWKFSVLSNPTFPRSEYDRAKELLDPAVHAEQYDGEFTSRRGFVFPQFDINRHITETNPHESWPVFRCVHHEKNSFNNPIVVLYAAIDPSDGSVYVYDEMYRPQVLVDDVITEMRQHTRGKRLLGTMTDYFNPTMMSNLKGARVNPLTPQEKKVPRKHAFVRRLQALQSVLCKGHPNLYIHSRCLDLINEFQNAKWPEPKDPMRDASESELPTTKFMNGPQALSYLVSFIWHSRGIDVYNAKINSSKRHMEKTQ